MPCQTQGGPSQGALPQQTAGKHRGGHGAASEAIHLPRHVCHVLRYKEFLDDGRKGPEHRKEEASGDWISLTRWKTCFFRTRVLVSPPVIWPLWGPQLLMEDRAPSTLACTWRTLPLGCMVLVTPSHWTPQSFLSLAFLLCRGATLALHEAERVMAKKQKEVVNGNVSRIWSSCLGAPAEQKQPCAEEVCTLRSSLMSPGSHSEASHPRTGCAIHQQGVMDTCFVLRIFPVLSKAMGSEGVLGVSRGTEPTGGNTGNWLTRLQRLRGARRRHLHAGRLGCGFSPWGEDLLTPVGQWERMHSYSGSLFFFYFIYYTSACFSASLPIQICHQAFWSLPVGGAEAALSFKILFLLLWWNWTPHFYKIPLFFPFLRTIHILLFGPFFFLLWVSLIHL